MKFFPIKASLVALAAVAATGAAYAGPGVSSALQIAQAEDTSQQVKAVLKFLSNGQDVSGMEAGRLQQRLNRAESLSQTPGLPPDLAQSLQQQIAQMQQELAQRQQGGGQPPVEPQARKQPPQLEDPPLPPYVPPQTQDGQPQSPQPQDGQPQQTQDGQSQQTQDAQQQGHKHRKHKTQDQMQGAQPGQPPVTQPEQPVVPEGSPAAAAFLQLVRPAAQLSRDEIRQQMQQAMQLSQEPDLSPGQRDALRSVIRQSRAAMAGAAGQPPQQQAKPPQGQAQPPQPQQTQQQPPQQQPGTVDPAQERQAQIYLNDHADVQAMNRKQLRKRLTDIRDLLASDKLSPQTREALRQQLDRERLVLRNQVATQQDLPPPQPQQQSGQPPQGQQQGKQQQGQPPQGQQPGGNGNNNNGNGNGGGVNISADIHIVLQDRRPPQQLDDRELVRRIDVYRDVVTDDRYDAQQRMMWQRQMEDDRRYLRARMIAERRQREAELRANDMQFNYDVHDRYQPGYDVPDDVFAAEADDGELAGVLAAPPRRAIDRRYTLDDIERYPQLRDSVARIEIDTVHFGFGEGFLREEEVDKLDRIATVLEKILARHPDEIFLIEGHTDAVGSDRANLVLSRQRALAVKQALVTYYVIPPENLRTIGLGERYLKIPTDQPEAENRRVSLSRITPLLGQGN